LADNNRRSSSVNNEKTPTSLAGAFQRRFLVYQFKLVVSGCHPGRQYFVAARLHDELIIRLL